jgi:hypothetical protein
MVMARPGNPENFLADVSSRGLVVRGIGRGRIEQTVPRSRKVRNRHDHPDRNRSGHRQHLHPGRAGHQVAARLRPAGRDSLRGLDLIQGLARRGFSIPHDDASLLANGALGWIQVVTFLMVGAMTIAAAVGVHHALPSRWAPLLIGLYGAGLMAAGVFRADPADGFGPGAPAGKAAHISWHGDGHLIAASVGFIAIIAACLVIARYLSRPGRRGVAIYSRITGVAFLAAFVGVTTGSSSPAVVLSFYAAVTAVFTWLAIVCAHLYRRVA